MPTDSRLFARDVAFDGRGRVVVVAARASDDDGVVWVGRLDERGNLDSEVEHAGLDPGSAAVRIGGNVTWVLARERDRVNESRAALLRLQGDETLALESVYEPKDFQSFDLPEMNLAGADAEGHAIMLGPAEVEPGQGYALRIQAVDRQGDEAWGRDHQGLGRAPFSSRADDDGGLTVAGLYCQGVLVRCIVHFARGGERCWQSRVELRDIESHGRLGFALGSDGLSYVAGFHHDWSADIRDLVLGRLEPAGAWVDGARHPVDGSYSTRGIVSTPRGLTLLIDGHERHLLMRWR